ncbi:MAG: class I SAM-dependent methyltransferase [Planctomycetaceae bacterium]|nr:class I SAM-dependent methyltransferase [Planctomycetaceae bacterium]MCB9951440.1 class I SAM-dependent methyltransferase [Planctomycetaceae bacterium]
MHAYQEDLAYIHESGFTRLAKGAAQELQARLPANTTDSRKVVELGCGGGTLAELLCQAGFDVTGYDISPEMIQLARARAPKAKFRVGSFVDAEIAQCNAVAAIGEVFNYLFDERNNAQVLETVLEGIYSSLQPGGLLLFDVAGPERAQALSTQSFAEGDDWTVLVTTSCVDNILSREIVSFRKVGELYRRADELHQLLLLDPDTIVTLLEHIGFKAERLSAYGNQKCPVGLHVFAATKSND